MGRKFAIAGILAGALVLGATPAAMASASRHTTFGSSSSHGKRTLTRARLSRLAHSVSPGFTGPTNPIAPTPSDTVFRAGYQQECTTPSNQNFHSQDTSVAFVAFGGPAGYYVSDCSANLAGPSAPKSTTGTHLTYSTTQPQYASVNSCRLPDASTGSGSVAGTGFTITYPDGLFVETCNTTLFVP